MKGRREILERGARAALVLVVVVMSGAGCAADLANRPEDVGLGSIPKNCKPEDLTGRLSPYLVDEASEGLRQDLEGVLKTRGLAVVRATCDKGIEVLQGCFVRGDYSYVALTPKDKRLVMKDEAQAQANLGFGVGQSLKAAFSAGREMILQYRLGGKFKTTVPGVVRGQLGGAGCEGATHFVASVDTGAFSSWTAAKSSTAAEADFLGKGGSAAASSEYSNLNTAGDVKTCPEAAATEASTRAPDGCAATIRVSLSPIVEADSVSALGSGPQAKETECRKGWVLTNEEICVPREEAKVYLCEPTNYEECRAMCVEPADADYSKRSCGLLADQLMRHILEADEDKAQGEGQKRSRIQILSEVIESNAFVAEAVQSYGPRFVEVCRELANGNTCALASFYKLITLEDSDMESPEAVVGQMSDVFELFQKGCAAGEQFSCEAAEYFLRQEEGTSEEERAMWEMIFDKRGVKSRNREYINLLTSSCDQGNGFSCFKLSKEHVKGDVAYLDINMAANYAERGCYGGLPHSCIASAAIKLKNGTICNDLLKAYTEESGTSGKAAEGASQEEAAFQEALTLDAKFRGLICKKSGRDAETNEVAISDLFESFEIFKTGCEYGDQVACQMSLDLYRYITDREIERIRYLEGLRQGAAASE